MFTPAAMTEINLFVQGRDIQHVTAALLRIGFLQLETDAQATSTAGEWSGSAGAYASQAHQLREFLDILGISAQPPALDAMPDIRQDLAQGAATVRAAQGAIKDWQDRLAATQAEDTHLKLLLEQLRLLAPVQIPIEQLAGFRILHLVAGTIPGENLARIQTALFRIPFVILPVHAFGDRQLVFAATTHEHAPILDRALRSAFFDAIPLPQDLTGLPTDVLADLKERQTAVVAQLQALAQEQVQLAAAWRTQLLDAWQRARTDALLADTIRRFPLQGSIYVVAGWTPADRVQHLVDAVNEASDGRAVMELLNADVHQSRAPTLLRNPPFFRVFEQFVTTFGYPAYNELDPTPILALSFLLMYGMMFGDIGHGLLLALGGVLLYLRRRSMRAVATLLMAAGVSGALFGLLYGTAFGVDVMPALWVRPMDSILNVLIAAVAGGIVLLNVGFLLHLVNTWRRRDWSHLVLDRNGLVGVGLYWALLGGGLAWWRGLLRGSLWFGLAAVPLVLLFVQEPLRRWAAGTRPLAPQGWSEMLLLAFFELFETVISYISNSLSFMRLGAFAVAHEGLSRVILLLAGMAGIWGRWPILIVGTVLLVGFEGLIVGIQTLRLEYYEFFGKFFQGDGRRFTPLRLPAGDGLEGVS